MAFLNATTLLYTMSYGDIEVLLEYFNSVVWFTQNEMMQG